MSMHPSPVQFVPPQSLKPHPSALLLPMSPEDEHALHEDIATHGILHPLDITQTNHILDGVHRWQTAQALALDRIPAQVFTYHDPQAEMLHAIRANLKRRHLSSSQKAMLALEVEKILAPEAKKRQGARNDITQKFEESQQGEAAEQAARVTGSNRQYVYDAKKIVALAPDLKAPVVQGLVTLPQAKLLATHSQPERMAILTSIAAGDTHARSLLRDDPVSHAADYRHSSESTEWYTPQVYIAAVSELMEAIDLDPASTAVANQVVKATVYYDKTTNGLKFSWPGRVFLNPPYGQENGASNQGVWAHRLIEQFTKGITSEAVLLVNAVTERSWFQPLWDFPICFTNHRIAFYNDKLTPPAPTHGNAFVYFGTQEQRFIAIFSRFGTVVKRVSPAR